MLDEYIKSSYKLYEYFKYEKYLTKKNRKKCFKLYDEYMENKIYFNNIKTKNN